MTRRLAFFAIAALSASSLVHCGSSSVKPPLASNEDDSGAPPTPVTTADASDATTTPATDAADASTGPITGTPSAMTLVPKSVAFGAVNCGTSATPSTVQVINNSTAPVSLAFYFEQNKGYFTGSFQNPTTGANLGASITSLPVAGAVSLVVTPAPIPTAPQTAITATNGYSDTIQLVVNGGSNTANAIPVTESAQGVIFAFGTTAVDFGGVPVSLSASNPIRVTNNGSEAALFTLTANVADGGANPFAVTSPTVPLAAGSPVSLSSTFAPTAIGTATGTITLAQQDGTPLCGPLPAPVQLRGNGLSGNVSIVTPSSIDFGLTNCGTQAGQAPVSIQNTASTGTVSWSAKFTAGGSYYSLSSASGTVNPLSTSSFNVIPAQIPGLPTGAPIDPDHYAATLQVTSGTNNQTQLISIHQTAQGVILTSTGNGASNFSTLAFGGVSVNQTATTQFTITNSGNVAVNDVQLSNTNPVFAVNPQDVALDGGPPPSARLLAFSLAPGQSIQPEVTFTPSGVGTANDTAVYTLPVGTVLCGAAPPNFTLSGTGNTGIAVSPTSLNFGLVQCGSVPPSGQQVTIVNKGGATTWSGTFGRGVQNLPSYYSLQDSVGNPIAAGSSQALAAGATATIYVVPVQISVPASTLPNAFSDALTITTTATGDSPHVISLAETAQGAFLAFSPLTMNGSPGAAGSSNPSQFTVTNSGNLAASFYLNVTMTQGNDTLITYPYLVSKTCQSYSVSAPFPNECAPPGACTTSKGVSYSITLPEMCTNLAYTQSSPGSLFGGQSLNGEIEFTGYPSLQSFNQALGSIEIVPVNAVLCSLPVPTIPLSEPAYN